MTGTGRALSKTKATPLVGAVTTKPDCALEPSEFVSLRTDLAACSSVIVIAAAVARPTLITSAGLVAVSIISIRASAPNKRSTAVER